MLSCVVRKADLLGLLAVAVVVAAVVADEASLLLLAAAVAVLMLGADRARPGPTSTPTGYNPGAGYPARLTRARDHDDAVSMADTEHEQQTEQTTTDEATVEGGAGDDDIVVVQQGDDLVSYKDGQEVDRRQISEQTQDSTSPQTEQRDTTDRPERSDG